MSAAVQLGQRGIRCLLVDDKDRLGGKLVLQTHRFFGSINAVYAGTRGIDIATKLQGQVEALPEVEIWLNSTALAVFSDQKVGMLKGGDSYVLVKPQVLLVAAGAREKSLAFRGNTLPGVYGAGAFQTLVNRDLVRAAERLFIVGGGNVGLIAGYHALQAGIQVVGLVEALPECGGYKVHKDKLHRMGVPIYTSHTILSANRAPAVSASNRSPSPRWTRSSARFRAPSGRSLATPSSSRSGSTPSTSSTPRRRNSGWRPSRQATPRKSQRHRRPCSRARSRGSRSLGSLGPRRRRNPAGLVSHRRNLALEARQDRAGGDPGRRAGHLPRVPLPAGNPVQSLHVGLLARRDLHRRERHPQRAPVHRRAVGQTVHRLREVRYHLSRPGDHARGLPQGAGRPPPSPSRTSSCGRRSSPATR